jgi:hypothetical protein
VGIQVLYKEIYPGNVSINHEGFNPAMPASKMRAQMVNGDPEGTASIWAIWFNHAGQPESFRFQTQHDGRNFGLYIKMPNFDEIFKKKKKGKKGVK